MHDINCISFLYSNVRSILPKLSDLNAYCSIHNPTVIALTETWLSHRIPDSFFCPLGYTAYRKDWTRGRGGGVIILIKETIDSDIVDICIDLSPSNNACLVDAVACVINAQEK